MAVSKVLTMHAWGSEFEPLNLYKNGVQYACACDPSAGGADRQILGDS